MLLCLEFHWGQAEDVSIKSTLNPWCVMLPIVLRRWSWCYFCVFTRLSFNLPLTLICCFSPVQHFDYLCWGRKSWFICCSCVCLFILYVLLSVFFSSIWWNGWAAACYSGFPWTFHLTFCENIFMLLTLTLVIIFISKTSQTIVSLSQILLRLYFKSYRRYIDLVSKFHVRL